MPMPKEVYSAGAAAATGFVGQWVLTKGVKANVPLLDVLTVGAAGVLAFMFGQTAIGVQRDVATGVLNGAAAYLGTRVPAVLGAPKTAQAGYQAAYTDYQPPAPAASYIPSMLEM